MFFRAAQAMKKLKITDDDSLLVCSPDADNLRSAASRAELLYRDRGVLSTLTVIAGLDASADRITMWSALLQSA